MIFKLIIYKILFIAEREGFEPPEQLPAHRISSAAQSTSLSSFLYKKTAAKVIHFSHTNNIFDHFFYFYHKIEKEQKNCV